MEKFFYMEGYNRAVDDMMVLLVTSGEIGKDELLDKLKKFKLRSFNEVEL